MADKNIKMQVRNDTNTGWDNLYPQTKIANIVDYVAPVSGGVVDKYITPTSTTNINGVNSKTIYSVTTGKVSSYTDGLRILLEPNVSANAAYVQDVAGNDYIPVMNSNISPSPFVASASTIYSVSYDAYYGFANTNASYWRASGTTGWLQIKLDKPVKCLTYRVGGYGNNSSYNPTSWTFQGSNDGNTWTTLHTVSNFTSWGTNTVTNTATNQTTAFQYFRLNITACNGGATVAASFQLASVNIPTTYYSQLATINVDGLGEKSITGLNIVTPKFYELRYDSGSGNFIASEMYKIDSQQVGSTFTLGTAANAFTINGVDINTDGGIYDIVISNLTLSSSTYLQFTINGNNTSTNYYNTPIKTGTSANNPIITAGMQTLPTINAVIGTLILANGTALAIFNSLGNSASNISTWVAYGITAANITSLTFSANSGNINSAIIKIFKRV